MASRVTSICCWTYAIISAANHSVPWATRPSPLLRAVSNWSARNTNTTSAKDTAWSETGYPRGVLLPWTKGRGRPQGPLPPPTQPPPLREGRNGKKIYARREKRRTRTLNHRRHTRRGSSRNTGLGSSATDRHRDSHLLLSSQDATSGCLSYVLCRDREDAQAASDGLHHARH